MRRFVGEIRRLAEVETDPQSAKDIESRLLL